MNMARKRTRRGYPPLPVVTVSHILPVRWSKYLESRFDDGLMDFEREAIEHWIKVNKVLIPYRSSSPVGADRPDGYITYLFKKDPLL